MPPFGVPDQKTAERIIMDSIIIKTYPAPESKCELVRLQRDANEIVASLQRCSGLSKSYIVSEIIRQASPYIEFQLQGVYNDDNADL